MDISPEIIKLMLNALLILALALTVCHITDRRPKKIRKLSVKPVIQAYLKAMKYHLKALIGWNIYFVLECTLIIFFEDEYPQLHAEVKDYIRENNNEHNIHKQ